MVGGGDGGSKSWVDVGRGIVRGSYVKGSGGCDGHCNDDCGFAQHGDDDRPPPVLTLAHADEPMESDPEGAALLRLREEFFEHGNKNGNGEEEHDCCNNDNSNDGGSGVAG